MKNSRVAFYTLGCKLNFAESSGLARELQENFQVVDFTEEADFYVIQSCSVTAAAEKKCRAIIRQAHKRNLNASVFVLGCMSQLRADQLAATEGVSMVLGNAEKYRLKELILNGSGEKETKVQVSDILKDKTFHASYSGSDRTRTFVKIQDGCDYFCSFCTIPLARGRSRSNDITETISLIHLALKNKPREIILTGVNIGDFGKNSNESLLQLLEAIEALDTTVRFRLSSIEPDLLKEPIISLVAKSEKFMPHFHIPLQSGSDSVLKRMNRKYDSSVFEERVGFIKSKMPFACIAADVIAGFPGETQEEFEETYKFIEKLPLSHLHVFPYSERPGTRAVQMPDKVRPEIVHERVGDLIRLSENKKMAFLQSNSGRIEKVLFESDQSDGFISGFTSNYIRLKAPFNPTFVNRVLTTRLNRLDGETYIFEPPGDGDELWVI